MDPISIVSLVLAAGKVGDVCASTGAKLRRLQQNYKDAPAILTAIEGKCDTVETAVGRVKAWAESGHATSDEASSRSLTRCLDRCHFSALAVERRLGQILSGFEGQTPRWEKLKFVLLRKEPLEQYLDEMRWQAVQAHFLISALRLPNNERTPRLEGLSRDYTV